MSQTSFHTSASITHATNGDRKMTIQPPWIKPVVNLILVGEIGAGKTAFLNLLGNVCAGIKLENFEQKAELSNELNNEKAGRSQTIQPQFYSIICDNGQTVNVLDTPGLGDVRGFDKDNEHKQAIVHGIEENFQVIDAVVILVNGGMARLNSQTEYTLAAISGMLPNSFVGNVVIIFTASPMSFDFDITSLPHQLQDARWWSIDNPLAQWFKYQKKLAQDPSIDENISEEINESIHSVYIRTMMMLSQFFQYLDKCRVQPVHSISEIYATLMNIETRISNMAARISIMEDRQTKLKKLHAQSEDLEHIMKTTQQYEKIVSTPVYETEVQGSEHNVLCTASNCYSNCLEDCSFPFTLDLAALASLSSCFEETPGVAPHLRRCKVCGHLVEDHRLYRAKWVRKIRTETMIDLDSKSRYETARTDWERMTIMMQAVQKEIEELERDTGDFVNDITDLCKRFNNLSLSGNLISQNSSAIRLLKVQQAVMTSNGADIEDVDKIAKRIKRLELKDNILKEVEKRH